MKSARSKQETLYSGQAFPMIFERLWKNVEFFKQVPEQPNQLEMWVMCLLMHGTLWAQICSIGTRYITWWLETTSPSTWLWEDFPTVPHMWWIKELGLVFTELGRPFILRSDNGPCYSSREFHNFLSFYQVDHIASSPHYPQSNGFAEALVGITKKLMEKSLKEGKLWNYGLLQYRTTPISFTLPSPLEMLTGRRPCSTLPQLPSSVGKNMETSRIHQELFRRQPNKNTSTGAMDLEPGQLVFVKEVNVWRTATVDQPAAEPDSYWVRFPDNSILRRTRSMIKPRSQPSHFELQAEAQPGNFEGKTY